MDARRTLPSVTALLELGSVRSMAQRQPRALVLDAIRAAVGAVRDGNASAPRDDAEWEARIAAALAERNVPSLRRVLNATGVVLHTNLGRAPLAAEAVAAMRSIAEDYCNIEYDIDSGSRGSRDTHCSVALRELTGAEDALVVNNCAAALVLALQSMVPDGAVAVSRGELVEIGGSFRVPDIMRASGVRLAEVGTTNRTHLHDYEQAIADGAAAVVKVHRSNFRMEGFTAEAALADLAQLCSARGVPLIHDFGSGLMLSLEQYGLHGEPTVRDVVRAGSTLTVMSGDKLLGGPQAGIIVGERAAIAKLRAHPMARAVRMDKITMAALAATLELYRDPAGAVRSIPVLRMLSTPDEQLRERAAAIADRLRHVHVGASVVAANGAVGAGAFPAAEIPSTGIALAGNATALADALRKRPLPVIGRIQNDVLVLNLRSVPEHDDDILGDTVAEVLG